MNRPDYFSEWTPTQVKKLNQDETQTKVLREAIFG